MSADSHDVDVVAVMKLACRVLNDEGLFYPGDNLCKATRAVDELIAACEGLSSRSDFSEWARFHKAVERVGGKR